MTESPTPDEIKERAATIRDEWDAHTEHMRRVTRAMRWTPPTVSQTHNDDGASK